MKRLRHERLTITPPASLDLSISRHTQTPSAYRRNPHKHETVSGGTAAVVLS
jgi:hypothetical protein